MDFFLDLFVPSACSMTMLHVNSQTMESNEKSCDGFRAQSTEMPEMKEVSILNNFVPDYVVHYPARKHLCSIHWLLWYYYGRLWTRRWSRERGGLLVHSRLNLWCFIQSIHLTKRHLYQESASFSRSEYLATDHVQQCQCPSSFSPTHAFYRWIR